jgi:hypothetical protein
MSRCGEKKKGGVAARREVREDKDRWVPPLVCLTPGLYSFVGFFSNLRIALIFGRREYVLMIVACLHAHAHMPN